MLTRCLKNGVEEPWTSETKFTGLLGHHEITLKSDTELAIIVRIHFGSSNFGSSHFLFERARCFSRSRALLVLSCPSVYNPVL